MVGKAVRVVVSMITFWIIILFHLYGASAVGLPPGGGIRVAAPPSCSDRAPGDCRRGEKAEP